MTNTNLSAPFQSLREASGLQSTGLQPVWTRVELESNVPKIQTDLKPAKLYLCCCPFLHFLLHLPQVLLIASPKSRLAAPLGSLYKTGWHGCGFSKLFSI